MQIHVIQNGEQAGPYSQDQFEELLRQSLIGDGDLYWHEGCDEWRPISQHPAFPQPLAIVLPPPAPPIAPAHRRPAPVGNPAKVCWECGHAVSPSAPMCPHCGKRLKMGCGTMFAIGIAIAILAGVVVVLGGASLLWSSWQQIGHPSTGSTIPKTALVPAPPATKMPQAENNFVFAIQYYVDRYAQAPNELVKTSLRTERRTTLTRLLPDRQVQGWVGTLKQLSTFSDGKASVVISLDGSPVTVHTIPGNPFSPGSDTSVEHGSTLYNRLAQLSPGEKVTFSGSFVPDEQDYLKETSLTEAGAMSEPEFAMRFADVAAALATSASVPVASPSPLVARAEARPESTSPSHAPAMPSPRLETSPQSVPTAAAPTPNVQSPRMAAEAPPQTPDPAASARNTVLDFYNWYLERDHQGQSPWKEGLLAQRSDVSRTLSVRSAQANEPEGEPDPILAGQHGPTKGFVLESKAAGLLANVQVNLVSGDMSHVLNVRLVRNNEDAPWQIDDVLPVRVENFPQPQVPASTAGTDLPQRLQRDENELNATYAQLHGRLDGRQKALLKQEELEWIKRKDALPANDPRRADMIERRINELARWGQQRQQTADDINRGFMMQGVLRGPSATADARSTPYSETTTPAQVSAPARSLVGLKVFEDAAHTCRLLVPEDGWVPVEPPPPGVRLALEGPGGIQLRVRALDGPAGDRTLAVLFAREVREQFPFGDMQIKPTEPNDRATKGRRTILRFSAQSRDPMQQMLQNVPDGPMKQGMLAGGAGAGPTKVTFVDWSVISEGSAAWVVELEDTIPVKGSAEVKAKITPLLSRVVRDKLKLSQQFEANPAFVYMYVRGRAVGMLDFALPTSFFDADGLTPVVDPDRQAADPSVAEMWTFFMDAQAW